MGVILLGLGGSCRQESPDQPASEHPQEQKGGVVYLDLGDIEVDAEVALSNVSSTTQARGIELKTPAKDQKLPTFGFAETGQSEEPFPVVLGMVGYSQNIDCYARATWKLIKETDKVGKTRYFVRAKGPMQFDQDPDFSKLKEGENWHLHALYAPGGTWDATTATWKFQAKKTVTKLYGPNEKLAIGKDIDIPFILGYNRELNNAPSGWNEGYTLVAARDTKSPSGWSFGMKRLTKKDGKTPAYPRFKMQGSLYAFKLRNNMKVNEPKTDLDPDELTYSLLTYRPTYDYSLQGFFVESTQATTAVSYSFGKLRMLIPEAIRRNIVQSLGLPEGSVNLIANPAYTIKATATTVPTRANPTRLYYKLTDSIPMKRQTTTGTFYFWMNEVDEQATVNTNDLGYGTSVYADLHNKTLSRRVGMTNVYHTTKTHKSGAVYTTTVNLEEELRLNPMARMGDDYLVGDPRPAVNNARFARRGAGNEIGEDNTTGDPGSGQLYAAFRGTSPSLQDLDVIKGFSVAYTDDLTPSNVATPQVGIRYSKLKWNVPDLYDVFSVFPYSTWEGNSKLQITPKHYPGILYNPEAGVFDGFDKEQVRLDGKRMTVTSYYYRKTKVVYTDQDQNLSKSVIYAFRFVGTPYATVFRYTESGRWHVPSGQFSNVSNDLYPSRESRFIIDSKSIGNHGVFRHVNRAQAKEFLENKVAKDEFWEENGTQRGEILRRFLHVNGDKVSGKASGVGQRMHFWTRRNLEHYNSVTIRRPNGGNPGIYYDTRSENSGIRWAVPTPRVLGTQFGLSGGGATGSYILPWLSVSQPNL